MKRGLIILSYSLLFIGFVGFIGGALINSEIIEYKQELPLGDVNSIVVDDEGLIFIGLGFYGKVQVYDFNGEFVRNWNVDNNGGAFNITYENDAIYVKQIRNHGWDRYDEFGELTGGRDVLDGVFEVERTSSFKDKNNTLYELRGFMFNQVYKDGELLITQNLFLKIMTGPFPAWLFFVFGGITLVYLEKKKVK